MITKVKQIKLQQQNLFYFTCFSGASKAEKKKKVNSTISFIIFLTGLFTPLIKHFKIFYKILDSITFYKYWIYGREY